MSGRPAETFSERLRRLREATGATVTAVAHASGVTEGTIRQLESGHTKAARFETGVLIADALGVAPRYLAFGDVEDSRSDLERRLRAVEKLLGLAP